MEPNGETQVRLFPELQLLVTVYFADWVWVLIKGTLPIATPINEWKVSICKRDNDEYWISMIGKFSIY